MFKNEGEQSSGGWVVAGLNLCDASFISVGEVPPGTYGGRNGGHSPTVQIVEVIPNYREEAGVRGYH